MSTKVWSRISTKKSDGTNVKLRIEEFNKGQIDAIIEFLGEYFINSENLMRASGAYKREESKRELLSIYSLILSHPTMRCQVCYSEDDPSHSIIGASMMVLDDEHLEEEMAKLFEMTKTPEGLKLIEILMAIKSLGDVKKQLGVSKSYTGRGVVVKPEYRGLGIAKEFVKIRVKICEEEGVPITEAVMTALGSQKAAESAGWETVFQIHYEELGKMVGVVFDTAPPICKIMAAKA